MCLGACAVFGGVDSVGIKRRLEEAQDEEDLGAEAPADTAASSSSCGKGIRQRTAAADVPGSSSQPSSTGDAPFTKKLIKKWAAGKISAGEVQDLAFDAERQGAAGLSTLSKMGNFGANPQNCYRALRTALGMPPGAPPFYWAEVPTIAGERTPHPFLLPHEFFASYFNAQKHKFIDTMTGTGQATQQFWQSMRRSDFIRHHPDMPKAKWPHTVPVGLHGDGAAFSHQDSVYAFSWNSLIGSGTTMQKRFVATVMKKSDMVKDGAGGGTMQVITRILSWSFNVMLSGVTPLTDWEDRPLEGGGLPLAGGWRAALCQVRGGWQFYCELFKFPQWNAAQRMCWLCQASSTNPALAWVRFGTDAGWRETRWTHDAYIAFLRAAGMFVPALLAVALGFRLECIMIDVLHTVDQGVAAHIIANVLWVFAVVRNVFGGANQEERVSKLFKHMQAWYSRTRATTKLAGKLTVERLRTKGSWPKLKAKAAATRHLAAYALHLAQEFGTGAAEDRKILCLAQLLCQFYEILESESQFLAPAAKAELPKLGLRLVGVYTSLAVEAKRQGVKLWKLMPKLHLFLHLCEWQAISLGNPRYYWTYADEDLAGTMAEIAESCHPSTMSMSSLFKWVHLAFPAE